jgi:heme/copper-type cytochrome/quinol oxidase subunit 2
MISRKLVVAAIVLATIVLAAISITIFQRQGDTPPTNTSGSNTEYFTIIESDSGPYKGMNGSAYHIGEAWPVIQVQIGDTVVIHIISENSTEAHGFTIFHYFDPGVGLLPGGTYTVKFVASENGTFLMTCVLFCAIHYSMDFGKFVVTE